MTCVPTLATVSLIAMALNRPIAGSKDGSSAWQIERASSAMVSSCSGIPDVLATHAAGDLGPPAAAHAGKKLAMTSAHARLRRLSGAFISEALGKFCTSHETVPAAAAFAAAE